MYIIYGRKNCGYCIGAMKLLDNLNLPYQYHDIVMNLDKREQLLEKIDVVKTVPQIFLNDVHIGGYTELRDSLD